MQIYGPLRVSEKNNIYQVVVAAAPEVTWAAHVKVQPMFLSILCLCVRVQCVRESTTYTVPRSKSLPHCLPFPPRRSFTHERHHVYAMYCNID